MNSRKINKEYRRLISSHFNSEAVPLKFEEGLVYTLYSEKLNLIKVGFAHNQQILEDTLIRKGFILLDQKKGKKRELELLAKTLNELGVRISGDLNLKYSNNLMRHLSILGWPIGRSLHKQRTIKKELTFA